LYHTKLCTMQLHQTIIKFPEINLQTRDAHKLRGYFGNIFKEHSSLLHNHFENGKNRYAYPLVQYKVIKNTPVLVGFLEGAKLLIDLFLKIKHINIEGTEYQVNSKNIESKTTEIDNFSKLIEYRFETLWMALNQKNHQNYTKLKSRVLKNEFLNRQLQNNILSFYKGIGFFTENRIMVTGRFYEKATKFKDQNMLAFSGTFVANAVLPDYVGLGKAVSRGFGTVNKNNNNNI